MNWDENQQDLELLSYLKYLIKIRKKFINFFNPIFSGNKKEIDNLVNYYWHGTKLESPDWSSWSHTVALSINKGENNPLIWVGLNAYSKSIDFHLPKSKGKWLKVIDTYQSGTTKAVPLKDTFIKVNDRSSVLIISEEVFGTKNNII
jgi:glycogen operon protein